MAASLLLQAKQQDGTYHPPKAGGKGQKGGDGGQQSDKQACKTRLCHDSGCGTTARYLFGTCCTWGPITRINRQ